MTDLPTLIARLEAAPEGSRELDAEIAEYLWGPENEPYETDIPLWTTSLDAAMTLIPEEWQARGVLHWPGYDNGKLVNRARVKLYHMLSSGGRPKVDVYGATRELAMSAAALRARGET